MKWFMKLSMGFLVLALLVFSFVYFVTPKGSRTSPVTEPGTESATSAPVQPAAVPEAFPVKPAGP